MSAQRKDVGRPSVDDLAAGLSARFGTEHQDDTPESDQPHTDVTPASHPKNTRGAEESHTRPAPPGMTRRSLYTTTAAFTALDEAAAQIQKATSGLVPKHDILARLLHAAAEQAPAVRRQLAADLARRLQDAE
ncbi:hypothetical protein [Nonomuraea typhae]|uniref:hypothetical protein n=1 Tax=Nonomuraea typhae TaxID=2603600 RepID=UPI0012F94097|nr:hypothetical protein [Nonomuraea typhae]